jgi:AraC family cel operon transcriptional repressor
MAKRLLIRNFMPRGQFCNYARREFRRQSGPELHCHDFHEVFWIERGSGWHFPDGRKAPLNAGDLVLVAPDDVHGFSAERDSGFCMVNMAFSSGHWTDLLRRYFSNDVDPFTASRRFHLDRGDLAWLSTCADELNAGDRSRAAVDRMLLNIMHLLKRLNAGDGNETIPDWLGEAVKALADPARFRAGPGALVAQTKRSHEHVARAVRRHYGTTPTSLVNRARMAWAAQRLAESDDSPLDVCLACGLTNLGHFYRLFRATHGASPEAWRQRQREVLGG